MGKIPQLREGERLDDLQRGGLKILQRPDGFRFGTDAERLFCNDENVAEYEYFRQNKLTVKEILEKFSLRTAAGDPALLICGRADRTRIVGVERETLMADMAQRSVALNGLEDRIRVVCCDIREAPAQLGTERFRLAVTNPPYTQRSRGLVSPSTLKAEARSADCPLEEWIHACARVLQFGGRLCMVYPASRLGEVIAAMQQFHLAPKRLRLVAKRPEHPPKLMLLEGKKGGGQGMIVEPLLVTHREDGTFSEEMRRIYGEAP